MRVNHRWIAMEAARVLRRPVEVTFAAEVVSVTSAIYEGEPLYRLTLTPEDELVIGVPTTYNARDLLTKLILAQQLEPDVRLQTPDPLPHTTDIA